MSTFEIGQKVMYDDKEAVVIDIDFDEHSPYATTYKIEINEPFQQRFWVHNTKLTLTKI